MRVLPSILIIVLLAACNQQPRSGAEAIRWDRQVCERCSMAIGDARFAAQIRGGPASEVYRFDDIGCALIWLDRQSWKDDAATEIWVADYDRGGWLAAREARYIRVLHSPMGYGLGAIEIATPGAIDFSAARAHIAAVEQRDNLHGGQHRHHRQDGAS